MKNVIIINDIEYIKLKQISNKGKYLCVSVALRKGEFERFLCDIFNVQAEVSNILHQAGACKKEEKELKQKQLRNQVMQVVTGYVDKKS